MTRLQFFRMLALGMTLVASSTSTGQPTVPANPPGSSNKPRIVRAALLKLRGIPALPGGHTIKEDPANPAHSLRMGVFTNQTDYEHFAKESGVGIAPKAVDWQREMVVYYLQVAQTGRIRFQNYSENGTKGRFEVSRDVTKGHYKSTSPGVVAVVPRGRILDMEFVENQRLVGGYRVELGSFPSDVAVRVAFGAFAPDDGGGASITVGPRDPKMPCAPLASQTSMRFGVAANALASAQGSIVVGATTPGQGFLAEGSICFPSADRCEQLQGSLRIDALVAGKEARGRYNLTSETGKVISGTFDTQTCPAP